MQRITANLSVLFAEITNQHQYRDEQYRLQAQYLTKEFLGNLGSIVWSNNGESIQTCDDKLMCTFLAADDAVVAATTMHQFAYARPSVGCAEDHSMGLRIRIGTGVVVREGNRLFGEAVTFAEKIKSQGRPFQTLISEATRNYLSREYADHTRFVGQWPINGNDHRVKVFEYIDGGEDATLATEYRDESQDDSELDLILGSTVLTLNDLKPVCTIGRQAENDIIMKYPRVSRLHAKIEKHQRKFVLKDTSFNGTYVKIGNLDTVCLKNDEIQLVGKGVIFPGREATSSSPGAIHYHIR